MVLDTRISERPVLNPDMPWEHGCMVYWFNSFLRNPSNSSELRCYYYVLCPLHGWYATSLSPQPPLSVCVRERERARALAVGGTHVLFYTRTVCGMP